MFKLTKLITLQPDLAAADRAQIVERLKAVPDAHPEIKRAVLQPTLPGVYNGGDFIWHMQFADAAAYRACTSKPAWRQNVESVLSGKGVAGVDSAAYEGGPSAAKRVLAGGVYRVLFLSVKAGTPDAAAVRFETETRAMPDYISTICSWQLSRVAEASGARPWTHVWEQEYADIAGLHGAYMMHPYHWGHIDRWFNPECADWIVDTYLCHTFCGFEGWVIG